MTGHYRWGTTLAERRRADPGIDDPAPLIGGPNPQR